MIPTVTVSIVATQFTSAALDGGSVRFELSLLDIVHGAGGALIVPEVQSVNLDANGLATIQLFPNVDGTQGSIYKVTVVDRFNRTQWAGTANVPAADCFLHDILTTIPAPSVSDAQAAANAAQASAVQTGLDRVQTGLDRVQTDLDAAATAADRAQTGADRVAADASSASASGSATLALAIYGNADALNAAQQIMLGYANTAQAQAGLAAGYAASAASAASVVQQDLSGVTAQALHRSPLAITALFVYDASKDSDGGAWVDKCQNTSWFNEALNGAWLGAAGSETEARDIQGQGASLVTGDSSNFAGGVGAWAGFGGAIAAVNGRLRMTAAGAAPVAVLQLATVIGQRYKIDLSYLTATAGKNVTIGAGTLSGSNNIVGLNILSTANGPNYVAFVATGLTTFINIQGSGTFANGDVVEFDDITVRPVDATAAALGGGYYQSKADGKFYVLSAAAGITETFRGNTAKFPRLSAIVADGARWALYDLTQPGRPMWKSYPFIAGTNASGGPNITSLSAMNGKIVVGGNGGSVALRMYDLLADQASGYGAAGVSYVRSWASALDYTKHTITNGAPLPFTLASSTVNSIAMMVRPNAPGDPVTGLPVPTIAVAVGSGSAGQVGTVLMDDGSVVTYSQTGQDGANVNFTRRGDVVWSIAGQTTVYAMPLATANVASISAATARGYASSNATGSGTGVGKGLTQCGDAFSTISGGVNSLNLIRENPSAAAPASSGLSAQISGVHSTGWMNGDVRRCLAAAATAGALAIGATIITDGTFDNPATSALYGNQDGNISHTVSGGALNVTTNAAAGSTYVYYTAATEPGVQYTVSAAFTAIAGCNGGFFDVRDGTVLGGTGGPMNTGSGNYTAATSGIGVVTTTFIAISPTTTIRLAISKTQNDCSCSWDNFSASPIGISDRSYKNRVLGLNGTLVRTAVAAAAQLVAWSGFSSLNYLQEAAASVDLDPGTGAVYVPFYGTLPTVLPVSSFPVVGAELVTNGDFGSAVGWTAGAGVTIGGGVASYVNVTSGIGLDTTVAAVVGKVYLVQLDVSGWTSGGLSLRVGSTGGFVNTATGNGTFKVLVPCTGAGPLQLHVTAAAANMTVDNVSCKEVGISCAFDRSAAAGSYYRVGVNGIGQLVAECFDGVTTRTAVTASAFNTGQAVAGALVYDGAGTVKLMVNGVTSASATGAALTSLSNAAAIATYGNRRTADAPWPGSLWLVKAGLTAPSDNAAKFVYSQESEMFRAGAQVLLPDLGGSVAVAYDDMENKLKVVTAANEASFVGLVRTATAPVSAGSFIKASMRGGVKLLARSGIAPGVDVTLPAYGLREELYNRAERAAALARNQQVFDFDAIAAQTDFPLPLGWTAVEVISSGASKREGATKDWTRLFDGFVETPRFGVAPGAATWVQVAARRAA